MKIVLPENQSKIEEREKSVTVHLDLTPIQRNCGRHPQFVRYCSADACTSRRRWQEVGAKRLEFGRSGYERHSDRVSRFDKLDVSRGAVRRIYLPTSNMVGRGRGLINGMIQ